MQTSVYVLYIGAENIQGLLRKPRSGMLPLIKLNYTSKSVIRDKNYTVPGFTKG